MNENHSAHVVYQDLSSIEVFTGKKKQDLKCDGSAR